MSISCFRITHCDAVIAPQLQEGSISLKETRLKSESYELLMDF